MPAQRLPIVGVMGSGTRGHHERAGELGAWLARQGVHLLTGGGGGVMAAVCEAFQSVPERRGLVVGVLPQDDGSEGPDARRSPTGYPNPWVEIAIRTHLPYSGTRGRDPLSRNHINVLSSDVVVALPGGAGTASEVALSLAYARPVIAWVDERSRIEGLPDAAPSASDFAEVRDFVLVHAFPDRLAGTQ